MISSTGDGLNIIIACDYVAHHNWMAFFCWYSITKNLPEAKITVICNRNLMTNRFFFWTQKCHVPFILHTPAEDQVEVAIKNGLTGLMVEPQTVCVRDFEESGFSPDSLPNDKISKVSEFDGLCCDAKTDNPCVFVTYSEGWGKFVTSSWIHKLSSPFAAENRYGYGRMTVNENRIGRLWNKVAPLFLNVSGE